MVNKEWARMLSWRVCYSLVVFIARYMNCSDHARLLMKPL